uniref:Uncharacterized protein n=1 Tax=Ascaris lumbricoides TaxID=6252 RepID=A0A0M3HUA4_ASCLU
MECSGDNYVTVPNCIAEKARQSGEGEVSWHERRALSLAECSHASGDDELLAKAGTACPGWRHQREKAPRYRHQSRPAARFKQPTRRRHSREAILFKLGAL